MQIGIRKIECEQVLNNLMNSPAVAFTDPKLQVALPKTHGVYAISQANPTGKEEFLHAGKTKDGCSGLRGRIWEQHYKTGGSAGDLIEKVIKWQRVNSRREAQEFIRSHCKVRWLVIDNEILRGWAEHYILAVLRPIWCS